VSSFLALVLLALAPQGGVTEPDESPELVLARAEELACAGRHKDARALYARLAKEHPGTEAGSLAAKRSGPSALLGSCTLVDNGPPENRVEIVLLGDGYELDHQRAFDELAEDVPVLLERVEPFREYWRYFNVVRGVCVSADAGIDGFGRDYDTLLGGHTLDTDAGHAGVDGRMVADALGQIPGNDGLAIVFVKLGILGIGGGGLAVIGGRDARTVVHEWGHAFAGLGDEYSDHTHERGSVPTRINISATEDPKQVPWRHWLEARHPNIGIHEGGAGQAMNAWRPTPNGCLMNNAEVFCPVCREALVLRIYSIVDPIDSVTPRPPPPEIREPILLWNEPVEIEVRVLRPASHDLELSWWIEPAANYTLTPSEARGLIRRRPASPDRRDRGRLLEMATPPTRHGGAGQDGVGRLRLSRVDLEPGLYRITCRVRDTTELPGERFPWVLKDELGLLESERIWWLEVR
jgi:IgA peptidase M64